MKNIEGSIRSFVDEVKNKYGDIISVFYEYHENDDIHYIWHDNYNLEYNDDNFASFIGKELCMFFFDNGIFNVSFSYNHKMSKQSKIYCVLNDILINASLDSKYINTINEIGTVLAQKSDADFRINDFLSFTTVNSTKTNDHISIDICMEANISGFIDSKLAAA